MWLVATLAVLVYANTLTADFALDDVSIVRENKHIATLKNIPFFFRTDYWHSTTDTAEGDSEDRSVYRPLALTSYALNHALHGYRPAGYHVTNVLLHAAASVLLLVLVRTVFDAPRLGFAAALLFAVHPIHTEAVAGVVGRAEIMAFLGILTCGLGYEQARRAANLAERGRTWAWIAFSITGYLAGMFSKETGVVAPALIVLWEMLLPERRWLLKADRRAMVLNFSLFLAAAFYLAIRSRLVIRSINEGLVGATPAQRILTALRVAAEYVGLLLAPARLSADYSVEDVPLANSLFEPGVLLALAMLLTGAGLFFWSWKRSPGACWGLGVFALALFPVSNLPFAIGVMKAERILYTPSAGFLLALAALLPPLWSRANLRGWGWVLLWLVAGIYAGRTVIRNQDWHDNHALMIATLKTSPKSALFHRMLGQWYREQGQNGPAREHYVQALEGRLPTVRSNRGDAMTWFNLGNIDLDERRYEAAIQNYTKCLQVWTNYVEAMNNLGLAHYHARHFQEAATVLRQVIALRPAAVGPYMNLVSASLDMNDIAGALTVAEEAARRFPQNAGVLWNLGAVYERAGRTADAASAFARAVKIDPSVRTGSGQRGKLQ